MYYLFIKFSFLQCVIYLKMNKTDISELYSDWVALIGCRLPEFCGHIGYLTTTKKSYNGATKEEFPPIKPAQKLENGGG